MSRSKVKVSPNPLTVRSDNPKKSYSALAVQLGERAYSTPPPTRQPPLVLLVLTVAPVVRLVMLALLRTQPPVVIAERMGQCDMLGHATHTADAQLGGARKSLTS